MFFKRKQNVHPLDRPLFSWGSADVFRVRDLLNGGSLILGRAGSGKTSSSGRTLMQAIVDNPKSGGLILAAKPEDTTDIQKIFAKAGRLGDLALFSAERMWRTNFFVCLKSPRDVVTFITTMSEVMKRGDSKGGGESRFYEQAEERTHYNTVSAMQAAKEPITAANMHRFIMGAAKRPYQKEAVAAMFRRISGSAVIVLLALIVQRTCSRPNGKPATIPSFWNAASPPKRRLSRSTISSCAWTTGLRNGRSWMGKRGATHLRVYRTRSM